jgi:hypothetical protein
MASAAQAKHLLGQQLPLLGATGELGKHIKNTLLQPDILSTFSGLACLAVQTEAGR